MQTPKAEHSRDSPGSFLERLGLAIADGTLAPRTVLRIDELEAEHKVARSVVREATKVLCSMGMLESRRRLGTVVQEEECWNLYDPQVIRWRLASPGRLDQLRALNELRGAIEPQAARLAADRISLEDGSELVSLAARLWAAGQGDKQEQFLTLDIEFHAAVLRTSGNPMFSQLHNLVREVLSGRTEHGLVPHLPHHEALQLHVDVASAIQRGEAEAAHAAMSRIVEQSTQEMGDIWSRHQGDPASPPSRRKARTDS